MEIRVWTCNVTFVCDREKEGLLVTYLRNELIPSVFQGNHCDCPFSLKKIVEIGGEDLPADHGLSVALSADFLTREIAHQWLDDLFYPAMESFQDIFGREAVYFVTLLERIGND